MDLDYYQNHAKVFVETYSVRLQDCNSGRLNVSYIADELGHAFDLSKSELESNISSILATKPSSFNPSIKFLEERVIYREISNLEITLRVSIKLTFENVNEGSLVLYYKSESNNLADGFSLGLDGVCSTEVKVSEEGGNIIEIAFPSDATALYLNVLDEKTHMCDFLVSVIEFHNNVIEPT